MFSPTCNHDPRGKFARPRRGHAGTSRIRPVLKCISTGLEDVDLRVHASLPLGRTVHRLCHRAEDGTKNYGGGDARENTRWNLDESESGRRETSERRMADRNEDFNRYCGSRADRPRESVLLLLFLFSLTFFTPSPAYSPVSFSSRTIYRGHV